MLVYKGSPVDVWTEKGKISLNKKTSQKDLKFLKNRVLEIEEVKGKDKGED